MADPVMVNCPRCRGRGEREQPVFSGRFDDAHVAVFVCDVCGGSGKVGVLEDEILSAEPPVSNRWGASCPVLEYEAPDES